ncbi:MAG: hypothetical protein AB8B92_08345 [Gammaproteobacteria bacterium]
MKTSSPLVCWILAVVTSGLYCFYWLQNRSSTINELTGNNDFNGGKMAEQILVVLLILIFIFALGLFYDPNHNRNNEHGETIFGIFLIILLPLMILYFVLIIRAFFKVGEVIKNIQISKKSTDRCSRTLSWFLLFVAYFNIPYLQSHLNGLIENVE